VAADRTTTLLVSGTGEVVSPTTTWVGVGSGGAYALAAGARSLAHTDLAAAEVVREAMAIAAGIDIYTNDQIYGRGAELVRAGGVKSLTPREIVAELDRHIVGQGDASGRWRWPCATAGGGSSSTPSCAMRWRPKNILMVGPTGSGRPRSAPPPRPPCRLAVPQGRGLQVHRGRLRRT